MATSPSVWRQIAEPFTQAGRQVADYDRALREKASTPSAYDKFQADREAFLRQNTFNFDTSVPVTNTQSNLNRTGSDFDQLMRQFTAPQTTGGSTASSTDLSNFFANTSQTSGGSGGVSAQRVGYTPLSAPRDATFTPYSVDRSLYQLEESAAERQALIDARADLDARARAGAESVIGVWKKVEDNNRAAAEKSRVLAQQYGNDALGLWVNAANQAREASVLRAAAVMANQGRAPIDLDPMAGGGAFIAAMESLALPEAERAFAEGQMQAERSEFMGGLAQLQSAAYRSEITRTSQIMAADMAREHNARVLERIARERLSLQESEQQAGLFNRQMQAQIERENIERRFAADQFNTQNRLQVDQFNAQMRQAAAAASASGGGGIEANMKRIQDALYLGGLARDGSGPSIVSGFTGLPLSVARELLAGADAVRRENIAAQSGRLPPVIDIDR